MRTVLFARGMEFRIGGKPLLLKRLVDGVWQAENQNTGAYETLSLAVLNQLYTTGKLKFAVKEISRTYVRNADNDLIDGYLNNLEPKVRELLVGKRWFLINYQNNYGNSKTTKMMDLALNREWNKACPNVDRPSCSAALKWLSKFEKSGNDIRSLFPRFDRCGNRTKRINEEVE